MSNKRHYFYWAILIIYTVLVFFVGFHHEPWADEAQAFLYARDFTIKELLFEHLRYEGHPIAWYLIIKLILQLKILGSVAIYQNFFILPCILNILGIYLLLFKSKLPTFLKIFIPFTFYLLYLLFSPQHLL